MDRGKSRDGALTFRDLHAALGRVVCSVPRGDPTPLDGDDLWMSRLGSGDVLSHAIGSVRASFARLDRGLAAREARASVPAPVHGVVESRPIRSRDRQSAPSARIDELEASFTHDSQVLAAGDQVHGPTCYEQRRSQLAPEATGPEDRDQHDPRAGNRRVDLYQ